MGLYKNNSLSWRMFPRLVLGCSTDPPNKDVIEEGGKKAWNDAYRDYLN